MINNNVKRGEVLFSENIIPEITKEINAKIFWMSPDPIKKGEEVLVRCGTQEIVGKIEKINSVINSSTLDKKSEEVIEETDVAEITITAEEAMIFCKSCVELSRLVLEVKGNTVAGGII
jgi:bifunctional enzyme CysN/CysC